MPDPTTSESHAPPAEATCPERWASAGVAHACSWISHEGDVHKCVCGDVWRADVSGCRAVPAASMTGEDLRERLPEIIASASPRNQHKGRPNQSSIAAAEAVWAVVSPVLERQQAEIDLLRETLAESDLGAQVLAQWEAIAAADADRDRLEHERNALKAAVQHLAAEAHRRKWAWEGTNPGTFEELRRIGNELLAALGTPTTPESPQDPLHAAIECVLLDYANEVTCPAPDPNLSELAHVYRQRTGWDLQKEIAKDAPTERDGGGWLKQIADMSLAAARDKFGPGFAPGSPKSSEEGHVGRHGRSWDPHPFVQSRAVDNVGVCICGLSPDHPIHHRAPKSPESEETR